MQKFVRYESISKRVDSYERSPKESSLSSYDIFLWPIARLVFTNSVEIFPIDLHPDAVSKTK